MAGSTAVRLRGVTWEHPRGFDSVVAASRSLHAAGGAAEVAWEARSLQSFGETPVAALATDYDLIVLDHPHLCSGPSTAALLPVDAPSDDRQPFSGADFVGRSGASYRYEDRQWAWPVDAAAQVAVHRPDLLVRPPESWPAVLGLAEQGRVRWPWKPIDAFSSLITVAGAFGWRPAGGAAGVFPSGEAGRAALAVLTRLARLVPEEDRWASPIGVHDALARDDRFWFSPLVFGYSNYSRIGFRPHRLRVSPPPAGPAGRAGSLLGGAGVAVSRRSEHPAEAQRVARLLAQPAVQIGAFFDGGGQPAHVAAWSSRALDEETDGFFGRTRQVLESAVVRPKLPGWVDFQDVVAVATTAVLAEETSPDRYWSEVDDAAHALLEGA